MISSPANRTVLVTGGAGYIGAHACKALARAGYLPVTYDSLVHGHDWAVRWGPLERGDICDSRRLSEVITTYRPAAIMHFAAFACVGESVTDPAKYFANNVAGSLTLLQAARAGDVPDIVFSSTCATYGTPTRLPIDESHPQAPVNPYGSSKYMVERMLADFCAAYGMRAIALRYFNAAGADPDGEIGEVHEPETHLIPLVLDAASGARPDVTIFGTDYATEDGSCIRDYVHVSDLADAHVAALKRLQSLDGFDAFNLGNGAGYSVREIISAARKITGRDIPVRIGARRPGDPPVLISNPARAATALDWQPCLSAVDDIIATAWRWHLSRSTARSARDGRNKH